MKTFKCFACRQSFETVKNLQPVRLVSGKMCQHCYASRQWGKDWANECRKRDPRMNPLMPETSDARPTNRLRMYTALLVLVLVSLSVGVARAEESLPLPNEPIRQPTPTLFWGMVGGYTAGVIADTITTQRMMRLGCREVWSPMLYGKRPTVGRFAAVSFGGELAEVIVGRRMVRSRSRLWQAVGYAMVGQGVVVRADASIHNEGLTRAECAK